VRFIKEKKKKHENRFVTPKYKVYIKSGAWKRRKAQYYQTHPKQCVACKNVYRVGLHHINYKRVGRELDEDLVALCWNCHGKYHGIYGVHQDNEENTYTFIDEKIQVGEMTEIMKHL